MKNQFWAVGCGLGWTVKIKVHEQKIDIIFFFKYCRVHTEKLHRKKVNKSQKDFGIFYRGKPVILGLKL